MADDFTLRPFPVHQLPGPRRVRARARDRAGRACESPESRVPDPRRRPGGGLLPGFRDDIVNRIRQARDENRRFVGIFPVGPMPQYRSRPDDQRRAPLPRARSHVQHGRVRERGRGHGAALVARLVPARDVGALLRPRRRRPAPSGGARSTFRPATRSRTTRSGSRTSAAPTSVTAVSGGAATSRSGSRISASSSTATWPRTSRPAHASSSSIP